MPRATRKGMPGVAHFHPEFLGRSETFIYRSLVALQRVRPVVFTRRLLYPEEFHFAPIVLYPPAPRSPWGLLDRAGRRLFRREPFLARQFRRHAVRLLHAHYGPMGWELLRVGEATGLPLVTTFYGYDMSMLPAQGDWAERYATLFTSGDLFLVEGPHMRTALIRLGCPAGKVRIQRIGINLALIPFRPRGPAVGRPARLLFCGRFAEKKGLPDALEALAAVRARHQQVELCVIGDGEERPRVEQLIVSRGLRDCVRLLGLQPYEVLRQELAVADILLAPSRTAANGDSEGGAPTILLEAQAAGLPVVATTHADIPYVVVAGKSGLLAPEGDSAALAECLKSLLETPERWAEMGRAGRRHVEQEHDVRTTAAGLEEAYLALITESAMAGRASPKITAPAVGETSAWLLDLLVCPDCQAPLVKAGAALTCGGCGRPFAVADGIPQLLPTALASGASTDPAWQAWAGALDRLLAWRRQTWGGEESTARALQRAVRGVQAEFAAHCRLAEAGGTVLDVGCGSAEIMAALGPECRYVGVDPIPLPAPGGPPMVRGVGERLPFRAEAFNWVLILETLDHCQSPAATMAEILRVLKPGGTLCVEQYVMRPGWVERLARWWRGSGAPGRPAPADSPKVSLLDAPDLLALIEPAFADLTVGRASQGSHLFLAARGKRNAPPRS